MNFNVAKLYLITDEKQRSYFTGFSSTAGYVILTATEKVFVVDSRYFSAAEKQLAPKGIKVHCGSDHSVLKGYIKMSGTDTIGIDFGKTTIKEKEALNKLHVKIVDVSGEIERAMSVKTEEEIENVKKACAIAEKSFTEAIGEIRPGITERELAAILEFRFKMNGASGTSFDTIVAFGANSAVPHHETGDTKLKENMPVLMDFGCVYNGYCSDMTRTFFYGTPTREFVRGYNAVLKAHEEAYVQISAGMTGIEADAVARNSLKEDGYGEYFTHSLGHGIGVNIHEYPWVSPKAQNVLENGMIFSIEPGIYLDGKFGVRIEDTVCMLNGKPVTFMKQSKCLSVLVGGKLQKYGAK